MSDRPAPKELPILFNGSMIREIFAGRKTQTRRLVSERDVARMEHMPGDENRVSCFHAADCGGFCDYACGAQFLDERGRPVMEHSAAPPWSPFGLPGERLWVKETFAIYDMMRFRYVEGRIVGHTYVNGKHLTTVGGDSVEAMVVNHCSPGTYAETLEWDKRWPKVGEAFTHGCWPFRASDPDRWRPSIFMPRWASRLTLEVTEVRCERLQAISEKDASAEGIEAIDGMYDEAELCRIAKEMRIPATESLVWFRWLWDSINGDRAAWESNPWVWVVSFAKMKGPPYV